MISAESGIGKSGPVGSVDSGTGDLVPVGGAELGAGGGVPITGTEPTSGDSVPDGGAEPSYVECMAELEDILSELEADDPDVDLLADRVRRAATLIEICRRRITQAGLQVERVVAELETDPK